MPNGKGFSILGRVRFGTGRSVEIYDRVSYFLLLGISGYFRVNLISSCFLEVVSQISRFFLTFIEGLPEISGNTRYFGLSAT